MPKAVKWILIILIGLGVLAYGGFKFMQYNTKKASPESEFEFVKNDTEIEIFYNRPYKKERIIFGELVPFGQVWRTGANEPTTIEVSDDIKLAGQKLAAGEYSIWTIPTAESWEVIFNSKVPGWGVSFEGVAARDAEYDALKITVPVQGLDAVVEQFTIQIREAEQVNLEMMWDQTKISIPVDL